MLDVFLKTLHQDPADSLTWLAIADWLEENNDTKRAELVRLCRALWTMPGEFRTPERIEMEDRVSEMLLAGVQPVVPEITNSIGMRLALAPAGTFWMGSTPQEQEVALQYEETENWLRYESPRHQVELTKSFYVGVHQVTQEQYFQIMDINPSSFVTSLAERRLRDVDTSDFPVENVTWRQAVEFCRKLSARPQEKAARRKYRLPTEAEWEYACRGGNISTATFCFGDVLTAKMANFDGRSPYGRKGKKATGRNLRRPTHVGSYPPNAFGLYDMHANVTEWCQDYLSQGYYAKGAKKDPKGARRGVVGNRVLRGGCWTYRGRACRTAFRDGFGPDNSTNFIGFRVVFTHPQK